MVTILSTELSQFFCPIPAICQEIELAGNWELQGFNHPLSHGNFRLETAASFDLLGMIESGPERQKRVLPEQSRKHPLMAKDSGHIPGMIFIPGTPWNLFSRFFGDRIIHDEKERGMGFNPQRMEEPLQSDPHNFLQGPSVLPQETGKAGKRPLHKGCAKGMNHGGGVDLLAQLNEADDKRGEELKRRS